MKNYSLPQAILFSFFSVSLYREVAEKWRARSLVYLFLVLLLCWTPGAVILHRSIERGVQNVRERVISELPALRFENGVLITPEPRAYVMEISDAGMTGRIVIDTTGKYRTLDEAHAIVLLTDKKAYVRRSSLQTNTYDFSRVKNMTFGPAEASTFLEKAQKWFPPILYPAIFILSFLKRVFQSLLTGLLGLFMIRWIKVEMGFPALFSLAVVSMTPTLIFSTVLSVGAATFPLDWLILGFVNFAYFLFAINAASDKNVDGDEDA